MTGNQRLLARLSDGEWHTSRELYRDLDIMVHSRAAELRKRGYVIERESIPGETGTRAHRYRLLSEPSGSNRVGDSGGPQRSERSNNGAAPYKPGHSVADCPVGGSVQLSLVTA